MHAKAFNVSRTLKFLCNKEVRSKKESKKRKRERAKTDEGGKKARKRKNDSGRKAYI